MTAVFVFDFLFSLWHNLGMATNVYVSVDHDLEAALRQFKSESYKALKPLRAKGGRRKRERIYGKPQFTPRSKKQRKDERARERTASRTNDALGPWSEAIVRQDYEESKRGRRRNHRRMKRNSRRRTIILPKDHNLTLAASQSGGAIIEFEGPIPKYPVIVREKEHLIPRFPFGGMNKVGDATFDPDVFAAITREVKEEIFSKLVLSEIPEDPDELPTYIYEPIPVDLNFGPEDIVCSLSCHDRSGDGSHYKTFCFKKMPGDTPISAGKDQLQLELWTAQQIMRAIDAGESAFQRDHADAFKIAIEQGLVMIV